MPPLRAPALFPPGRDLAPIQGHAHVNARWWGGCGLAEPGARRCPKSSHQLRAQLGSTPPAEQPAASAPTVPPATVPTPGKGTENGSARRARLGSAQAPASPPPFRHGLHFLGPVRWVAFVSTATRADPGTSRARQLARQPSGSPSARSNTGTPARPRAPAAPAPAASRRPAAPPPRINIPARRTPWRRRSSCRCRGRAEGGSGQPGNPGPGRDSAHGAAQGATHGIQQTLPARSLAVAAFWPGTRW